MDNLTPALNVNARDISGFRDTAVYRHTALNFPTNQASRADSGFRLCCIKSGDRHRRFARRDGVAVLFDWTTSLFLRFAAHTERNELNPALALCCRRLGNAHAGALSLTCNFVAADSGIETLGTLSEVTRYSTGIAFRMQLDKLKPYGHFLEYGYQSVRPV